VALTPFASHAEFQSQMVKVETKVRVRVGVRVRLSFDLGLETAKLSGEGLMDFTIILIVGLFKIGKLAIDFQCLLQ